MKLSSTLWMSALLSALLLTACGEKAEEPAVTTEAPAAEATPAPEAAPAAAPAEAAPAPAAKAEPGGYEPAERVPGITMTQEEIDKMVQEGLANTPLPTIPGG